MSGEIQGFFPLAGAEVIDEAFLNRSGEVGGDGDGMPGGATEPDAIEDIGDDVFYSVGGEGAVVAG